MQTIEYSRRPCLGCGEAMGLVRGGYHRHPADWQNNVTWKWETIHASCLVDYGGNLLPGEAQAVSCSCDIRMGCTCPAGKAELEAERAKRRERDTKRGHYV